jgi:gamma-glutamylaminecyclotransferase
MPLIFVYGTLKLGGSNHRQIADQKFVGTGRTAPGYQLFDLGAYPGMVPSPEDRAGVTGEIWSVNEAALRRLDRFEGVDQGLYRRARIVLQPPDETVAVEAYLYNKSVAGRPSLGSTWPV